MMGRFDPPPGDLAVLADATPDARRGLAGLAAAASLTDHLAHRLLGVCEVEDPTWLMEALRGCNSVVRRNTEWRLTDSARQYLQAELARQPALARQVHRMLAEVSESMPTDVPGYATSRGDGLPAYLIDGSGLAYHTAELDAGAGLAAYSDLAHVDEPRAGWLGARLAHEQQERGLLPREALELAFLRGMVLYREGRVTEAVTELRPVAESRDTSLDVAVASHLVGRYDVERAKRGEYRIGLKMLRRSLQMGRALQDQRHVAHVAHTLALSLLLKEPVRRSEALSLLKQSLTLTEELGDDFGTAKVLHTWGQALSRSPRGLERHEAERMLRRSLSIGQELGYRRHQAAVLLTLSRVVRDLRERQALLDEARSLDSAVVERQLRLQERRSQRPDGLHM